MNTTSVEKQRIKKKILVVDDDPGILDVLQIMLEESGYEVETSQEALLIEKKLIVPPDIILLDMWMSGINGKDVCRKLKSESKTRNITIVMISANNDIEKIANESGADAFMSKPFQMNDLLALLEKFQ